MLARSNSVAEREQFRVVVVEHAEPLLDDAASRQRRECPHGVGPIGAPAVRADQTLGHERFQDVARFEGACDRQVPHVQLVDVDVVGLESLQAGFEVLSQPAGDVAVGRVVGIRRDGLVVLVHLIAELGGDDHFASTLVEGLTEETFAVPGAIVGGGVEERDTEVERSLQRSQRLGVVDLAPAGWRAVERPRTADRPAPHSEGADFDTGPTEHTSEGCCHRGDAMAVARAPAQPDRVRDRQRCHALDVERPDARHSVGGSGAAIAASADRHRRANGAVTGP